MNNAFKKMTRSLAWIMTASLAVAFMLPSNAAAIEFFPNPVRYQWVSQNGTVVGDATTVYGNAGDTVAMSLTIKNRQIDPAAKMLYGKSTLAPEASPYQGAHELRLGVKDDAILPWIDSSSFLPNPDGAANRLAVYDGPAANVNDTLTFNFNLKIASGTVDGTYALPIGLLREFDAWARQVNAAGTLLPSSDIFWNVVVGAGGPPPAMTGALTIALASDTPASQTIADNGNANFTKISLTAAAGTTVSVTEILVTRTGLSTDSQIENIKIVGMDGVQVGGTASGFNANHQAQVYVSPALEVTGTMYFYIRAGIVNSTTAGVTAKLGIAVNSDIVSNAASIGGAPVYGNAMTVVTLAIGDVTLAEEGSITDSTPDVGDENVLTNTFKLTAGTTENIIIEGITVQEAGSTDTSDTKNIELRNYVTGETLGTVAAWSSGGKAYFPLNITLIKGTNMKFAVYVDVVDGSGLTIYTDVSDGSDALVVAKGATYGFYITPTYSSSTWNGKGDAAQTINAGSLTVAKSSSTPATGFIAVADAQLLAVWDMTVKGEGMRVSSTIIRGNLADAGGSTTITFADMTSAYLVDMDTGNALAGPVDGIVESGAYTSGTPDPQFTFSTTYNLSVGVTKLGFKVNLGTDWEASDTIIVTMYQAADLTVKGVRTGDTIVPTGFAAAGNTQTVKAGALVVRTLGTPPTGNIIKGTTGFTWGTFAFDAGASGEDVLVTAVTITDTLDGSTGDMANVDNAKLYADLDKNGTYEALIDGPDFPTGGGGATDTHAFTFNQTVRVPKGTMINFIFVADLASGATADGTHTLTVAADGATCSGADTGTGITDTASGSGGTLTVAAGGSVTSALAASSPTSALIVAGNTYAPLGAFDFIASDEAYTIDTLTLDMTAGYDSMQAVKITYPTKTGTDSQETSVSAAAISFSNIAMYVPKNGRATVTVTGTTKKVGTVGTGGTFRDVITLVLDTSAAGEFNAVGEASGAAKTGSDVSDQTASTMYLYNTIPTVTADNPSGAGTITPGGIVNLYKFKVTADAAGAVAIKKFTFQIFITDASTTTASTADLGGFTFLRNGADITSSAQITQISTDGGATYLGTPLTIETDDTNDLENNTSYWVQVGFGNSPTGDTEQLVGAGETVTYTLRATAGTGFTTTDAWSTQLLYDTTIADATAIYLADADTGTGVEQVIALQTSAGISEWSDVEFLWSDRSTIIHIASFDDDGVVETSSPDWTNGMLLPNFPLSSYGYTL
ncbi:hypothetical protein KJ836_00920 [Patescibacteria group bacterium]|nr:hypothetical protein [Patescibacteria group bacterium]